jgi:hypothetical protein
MYIVEAMNQLCKVATSPCPLTIPARPSIRRRLDRSSARVKLENCKFFLVKPALVQCLAQVKQGGGSDTLLEISLRCSPCVERYNTW